MNRIRIKFVTLLFFCVNNSSFAGEIAYESAVVKFDGREWVADHASAKKSEFLVEYVLKGEKVENWTELVTTYLYLVKPDSGATSFMRDYYHDNILETCPEANWTEVYTSEKAIICIWDKEPCSGPDKTEYTMVGFVAGVKSLHVVMYAARDKQVFEKRAPEWRKLIRQVTFFHPDESEKDLQPDLLTDSTKMIHIFYRFESPSVPSNSTLKLPKRFWRSGSAYFRAEEQPSTITNTSTLMITSEPDVWLINQFDNTGIHMVNPGPTFNTICPVFGEIRDDGLRSLEFGKEQAFFEYYGARELADEVVHSKSCSVYELPRLYWVLRMYVRKDTGMPYKISRRGPDRITEAVYFDEYSPNLDFDSTLFLPPSNVRFESE